MSDVKSDWIELKQGVPQGTILGPLLFNLYVNDLTGQITEDARIIQYADDCLLFCSHQDPDIALQCLQTNILKLESSFRSHQLNLNGSKTGFITFSRQKDKRQLDSETVVVCSSVVKKKCECKYLGNLVITLDQHLTFQTQVKKVLKNMAVGIKTIESIRVGGSRSKERDRKSELVLRSTYQIFEWDRNNSDRNFNNVVRYVHIPLVP